jgi:membrane fusion protein, heavy metal efflux system
MPNKKHALLMRAHALLDTPIKRYSAAAGLAVVVILMYAWLSQEPAQRAATPEPIVQGQQLRYPSGHPQLALLTTTAAERANSVNIDLPARLVWNEERTQRIYPAFAGRVTQLKADVGQTVKIGQVLATLASPEFGAAQADTAKALADARLASRTLARQKELLDAGIVSQKDFDQAEADDARAQAEVNRAQARTRMYGSANAVNQQLGLAATVAGVVVERNLGAAQEVRPDQAGPGAAPLFVVTDPRSLWVQIDAHEADIASLKPGTKISLSFANLPNQSFEASITATGDFIDSNTRSIKVRGIIDNSARLLKAEMLGTARIQRQLPAGVMVPASAVQLNGKEHWVYVETERGVFEPRQIKVGYEGAHTVLITEGVQPDELVVKENSLLLASEFKYAAEKERTPESKP